MRTAVTARNDDPEYDNNEFRDGSDWSRGIRSRHEAFGQHDLTVGRDGYIYLTRHRRGRGSRKATLVRD